MQASQITERLLSTQRYPKEGPNRDQIRRMLSTISTLKALTRDENGVEITANLTQSSALAALTTSTEPMSMGKSLER